MTPLFAYLTHGPLSKTLYCPLCKKFCPKEKLKYKENVRREWRHTPLIPALVRHRHLVSELEASQGYVETLSQIIK